MQTIEIEDDVYGFLLRSTSRFGESPSDILKRLLKLADSRGPQGATTGKVVTAQATLASTKGGNDDSVVAFLNSAAFLVHGNAVGRFLAVLSWLCKQSPEKFEKVLLLNGRKRRYFAKSAEELEASGNSVMPKRIPDTPFWVFTNSPTQLKKQVVADVMRVLGYDSSTTRSVVDALR
jgi:negative modulator of initiation of replication